MHLPPIVGVCRDDILKGTQFAVLPLNSPVVSALREMEVATPSMQSNVQVSLASCQCGAFHVSLMSTADLCCGDTLVPTNSCLPRIIVQFDGSAHRNQRVGGAGAALLQVESNGVSLLDREARALPTCADNIVAETYGADLAIALYDKYRLLCQEQDLSPLRPLFPTSTLSGHLSRRGQRCLTRQFPVAKFAHKTGSKRKISTYFHRVSKRARQFWLRR